ncbi:hypothetical protein [Actinacidiphila glaucinigra]|uniref:hypothetical protein n=1 Tax=Actinacidiphila glaucinigra TaxID=235986 RepID=UPI0035D75BE3
MTARIVLALICFPTLAVLAAACLYALAPGTDRGRWLIPAARTAAILAAAVAYVAILFTI